MTFAQLVTTYPWAVPAFFAGVTLAIITGAYLGRRRSKK